MDLKVSCYWSGIRNVQDLSLFLSCVRKVFVALSEMAVHNTVL